MTQFSEDAVVLFALDTVKPGYATDCIFETRYVFRQADVYES